jgi:alpha-amylase
MLLAGCTANSAQVVLQSISLSPDTVHVVAGNSVQLKPVFTPSVFSDIAVDWSSTDGALATVSSTGLLYAVKPGTVTVKIKDKNSSTWGKCVVVIQ